MATCREAVLLALFGALVAWGCGPGARSSGAEDAVGAADMPPLDSGVHPDAPCRMTVRCAGCHAADALATGQGEDDWAAGRWMATVGEGLTRFDPSMPVDAAVHYELRWVKRGRHPADLAEDACFACHPVYSDGTGHSDSRYPDDARAQAHAPGGVGCAGACHTWLPAQIHAGAFEDASGAVPELTVSGRPEQQLAAVDSGHARLWRAGFQPETPRRDLHMTVLAPGCAGCHGAGFDRHGEIPGCTTCHDFGGMEGALHEQHVTAIVNGQAANDPLHPERGACRYCHDDNDPAAAAPDEVFRAACYNCHLNGHQPVGADGQPQLWSSR